MAQSLHSLRDDPARTQPATLRQGQGEYYVVMRFHARGLYFSFHCFTSGPGHVHVGLRQENGYCSCATSFLVTFPNTSSVEPPIDDGIDTWTLVTSLASVDRWSDYFRTTAVASITKRSC